MRYAIMLLSVAMAISHAINLGGNIFTEDGVWNYTTMLILQDSLIVGAREYIYALSLENINIKNSKVNWTTPATLQDSCAMKGKDHMTECLNYIRVLHALSNDTIYMCGTLAFNPTCGNLSYKDGNLTVQNQKESGIGRCPFDPFLRSASLLYDQVIYSATANDFQGALMIFSQNPINDNMPYVRTEADSHWLKDPEFIKIEFIGEGQQNPDGDDDKIYLFFNEIANEIDFFTKIRVPRVARVCKRDKGGKQFLVKRWTSFVKARLDCPVPGTSLPLLVKNVFLYCVGDWTTCVFYLVFVAQDNSQLSAVCAYAQDSIRLFFSEGMFLDPVPVSPSFKWIRFAGDVADPRPGTCIDNNLRSKNYFESFDLPNTTLLFIKKRPLLDGAIQPISQSPLLIKNGAAFTSIIVVTVPAVNGKNYQVMFIGTESGSVLKAVNYDGEAVIIEETQLFNPFEPVKTLHVSDKWYCLYAGSEVGVAQLSLISCIQYGSCLDCVLARDPFCKWNLDKKVCIDAKDPDPNVFQNLDGSPTGCLTEESTTAQNISFSQDQTIKLWCKPSSNLAQLQWHKDDVLIDESESYQIGLDYLLIFSATSDSSGLYNCTSVESSSPQGYVRQEVVYNLTMAPEPQTTKGPPIILILIVALAILSSVLIGLVAWKLIHFFYPRWNRQVVEDVPPPTASHLRSEDISSAEEPQPTSTVKSLWRRHHLEPTETFQTLWT